METRSSLCEFLHVLSLRYVVLEIRYVVLQLLYVVFELR